MVLAKEKGREKQTSEIKNIERRNKKRRQSTYRVNNRSVRKQKSLDRRSDWKQ